MKSKTMILVSVGAIAGGVIFFFLPGAVGIMSPDAWYDNPLAWIFVGAVVGAGVGWMAGKK